MENTTVLKAYGLFWRNIFNFRGTANRREYWLAVLVNAIIAVAGAGFAGLSLITHGNICFVIGRILIFFFAVSIIPFISLTVRRLHELGRSGWWTFLMLAVGVGTLWLLIVCASAAAEPFRPSDNQGVDVYGPPEWFEEYDPSKNQEATVYGSPDWFGEFDPSENQDAGVYDAPDFDK